MSGGNWIYLMRHGEAKEGLPHEDFKRSLTQQGKKQVKEKLNFLLNSSLMRPDCIYCSTALRTKETANLVQKVLCGVPLFLRESLYLGSVFRILDVLKDTDCIFKRILILGHRTGMEQMITFLSKEQAKIPLKYGDCVAIQLKNLNWKSLKVGDGEIVLF